MKKMILIVNYQNKDDKNQFTKDNPDIKHPIIWVRNNSIAGLEVHITYEDA